jgi:hypothetical protein
MLDKLPAQVRHILIAVIGSVLTLVVKWFNSGINPLDFSNGQWQQLINVAVAAACTSALLTITPLTKQYGIGTPPPFVPTPDQGVQDEPTTTVPMGG